MRTREEMNGKVVASSENANVVPENVEAAIPTGYEFDVEDDSSSNDVSIPVGTSKTIAILLNGIKSQQ